MYDNLHVKINLEIIRDWLTNNNRELLHFKYQYDDVPHSCTDRNEQGNSRDDTEDKNSCGRFVESRVFVVDAGIGYAARHANDRHIA